MTLAPIGLKLPIKNGNSGYFETTTDTFEQVSYNIKNIILTKPGERRFNNSFGSNLYKYLFEQQDLELNRQIILDIIQKDMDKFFNGVLITDVKVQLKNNQENNSSNRIFINVSFSYKETNSQLSLEISP